MMDSLSLGNTSASSTTFKIKVYLLEGMVYVSSSSMISAQSSVSAEPESIQEPEPNKHSHLVGDKIIKLSQVGSILNIFRVKNQINRLSPQPTPSTTLIQVYVLLSRSPLQNESQEHNSEGNIQTDSKEERGGLESSFPQKQTEGEQPESWVTKTFTGRDQDTAHTYSMLNQNMIYYVAH